MKKPYLGSSLIEISKFTIYQEIWFDLDGNLYVPIGLLPFFLHTFSLLFTPKGVLGGGACCFHGYSLQICPQKSSKIVITSEMTDFNTGFI